MKIVGVDNLNRETVADHLWLDDIPDTVTHKEFAERVCERLNRGLDDSGGTYYTIKENDYRLSRGMADIVGDVEDDHGC